MIRRAMLATGMGTIAAIIWLIAFLAYDHASRLDAWHTYNYWCERLWFALWFTPVLLASMCAFSIISWLMMIKFGLLPGRLVSAFTIGLVLAALILPGRSMTSRQWRERVANDRFCGFKESTIQYLAICLPVTFGFFVASRRKSVQ